MSAAADRRRSLMRWVRNVLLFYTQARNIEGTNLMLLILTAVETATDAQLAVITPTLELFLHEEMALLPCEGQA